MLAVAFLTAEQESELAYRWRDHRDESAMHQIVTAYQPLVAKIAKRFHSIPIEDAMQEGVIGLLIAASKFEPERGLRFGTFASWWVRAQITAALFLEDTVSQPKTAAARKDFFAGKARVTVRSMDAPVSQAPQAPSFGETMVCPEPRPDELVERRLDSQHNIFRLRNALKCLNERERDIIDARWLAEKPKRLHELGAMLGLSKERVRQIETKAIGKLKKAMLNPQSNATRAIYSRSLEKRKFADRKIAEMAP